MGIHRTDMDRGVHVWAMHLPPFQCAGVNRAWGERMLEDSFECAERCGQVEVRRQIRTLWRREVFAGVEEVRAYIKQSWKDTCRCRQV